MRQTACLFQHDINYKKKSVLLQCRSTVCDACYDDGLFDAGDIKSQRHKIQNTKGRIVNAEQNSELAEICSLSGSSIPPKLFLKSNNLC